MGGYSHGVGGHSYNTGQGQGQTIQQGQQPAGYPTDYNPQDPRGSHGQSGQQSQGGVGFGNSGQAGNPYGHQGGYYPPPR